MEHFLYPHQVLEVSIPVLMDDGHVRVFTGYRSQHNNVRWPYKWGIRYHHNVTKDEVMSLSAWMSLKTSVVGIPLWWAKWGIVVDPKTLSLGELERLTRWYVQKIVRFVWPQVDVPAPDVNTDAQIMAWFVDEYSRLVGQWSPGVVTGKPLSLWWSAGRWSATAMGAYYVLSRYFSSVWWSFVGTTFAIQWAWNAGLLFAQLVVSAGGRVIWLSDSQGAVFCEKGIDIQRATAIKENWQSLIDLSDVSIISQDKLLSLQVDVLVPAALESQITEENMHDISSPLILEIANGPITPEADKFLFSKGVVVLPDVLSNAWGVTVSYFEQVQNNMNYYRDEQEVDEKLRKIMDAATDMVINAAKEYNVSLRMSAYIVSLQRILESLQKILLF